MGANSLNTEDYTYLINNRDIITTCQEALRENDLSYPSAILTELTTDQSSDAKTTCTSTCSTNDKSQEGTGATIADYADWIKRLENELDNVCYCNISREVPFAGSNNEGHTRNAKSPEADTSFTAEDFAAGVNSSMSSTPIKKVATSQPKHHTWRPIVDRHRAIQAEVRSVGLRFKSILQDIANKKEASPSSAKQVRALETRWHKLWLRSLESLMLIEDCKCPNHLSGLHQPKLPGSSPSSSFFPNLSTPKDRARRQVFDQFENSPGVEMTASPSSQETSGFYSSPSLLLTSPTQGPPSSDQTSSAKEEKALKTSCASTTSGTGTSGDSAGSELISVKNRRIQTMGGQDLQDIKDSKFEVIQKDIGYSSDADMSDAYDARPQTDYINLTMSRNASSSSAQRKRQVRRRQRNFQRLSPSCSTGNLDLSLICPRNRPWSFHASSEWTDSWDYYIPPSSIHPQSSEDLSSSSPYEDDDTVRKITEFGENYEYWLKPDDVIIGLRDAGIHRPLLVHEEERRGGGEMLLSSTSIASKREVSTMTTSASQIIMTPVEVDEVDGKKTNRKRSRVYAIFVTFSLVSLFLSLLMTSSHPPHLDLEYRNPPPL